MTTSALLATCLTDEDLATLPAEKILNVRAGEGLASLTGLHVRRRVRPESPIAVFDLSLVSAPWEGGSTAPGGEKHWRPLPAFHRDTLEAERLVEALLAQGFIVLERAMRTSRSCLISCQGVIDFRHGRGATRAEAITRAFVAAVYGPAALPEPQTGAAA